MCPKQRSARRYATGLRYFEEIYKPIVNEWAFYDNSFAMPTLIEEGVNSWAQGK
jgi:hypothetical protein